MEIRNSSIPPAPSESEKDVPDKLPPPHRRTHSRGKLVVFALLALIGAVGLSEALLHVAGWISPQVGMALSRIPIVKDERLGWRPSPVHPEHDRLGFRNPAVPAQAEVVALGDSQTYGVGVATSETWTARLAEATGLEVYNLAYGGYGPAHHLILLGEALALKPDTVIEAFYTGNDLYDAYQLVYVRGSLPELRTSDTALAADLREREQADTFEKKVKRLHREGEDRSALRAFLAEHSRLYGLLRIAKRKLGQLRGGDANTGPMTFDPHAPLEVSVDNGRQLIRKGGLHAVLTPAYRLAALDLDDPRIAEGLRVSIEAMRAMGRRTTETGARFVILLIPTKERVFAGLHRDTDRYRRLLSFETQTVERIREALGEEYPIVDALPPLQNLLKQGRSPYGPTADGHPNALGHEVIAETVRSALSQPDAKAGAALRRPPMTVLPEKAHAAAKNGGP
jgi:lysophospholipase L1-like esterase